MRGLIVCGSPTDWEKTVGPFLTSRRCNVNLDLVVDICSCHRNPRETEFLARRIVLEEYDFVICIGGKAFALPGVLDAWIYFWAQKLGKKPVLVIGVALGELGSNALKAAQLSIMEIPGQPVLLDSQGNAYTNLEGLETVLQMAEKDCLPREQKPTRTEKPAKRSVWKNC